MVYVSEDRLDRSFGALADPNRRRILDRLADHPQSVSAVAGPLGMTRAGVLKHMRLLEQAHLVVTHKTGRLRMCALSPEALADIEAWIEERRQRWDPLLDRFAAHVATRRSTP